MELQKPMVSVFCTAYNHEAYIRDALEGFVSQQTNFPFEVLIHDDASTDGTADIIREYAQKYPHIIRPVYQTQNQYSQKVPIIKTFLGPIAQGKYIAYCEGDDYWCDPLKLQRQVDFLESHPEYASCVHNSTVLNCKTGERRTVSNRTEETDLLPLDTMERGNGEFQLSSVLHRRELWYNRPDFCNTAGFGDYPLAIYMSLVGKGIRYMPQCMSVYREFAAGSWTSRMYLAPDPEKIHRHYAEVKKMLEKVDVYTQGKYSEDLRRISRKQDFNALLELKAYKQAIRECQDVVAQISAAERRRLYLQAYCPKTYSALRKVWLRVKNVMK